MRKKRGAEVARDAVVIEVRRTLAWGLEMA